MDNHRSVWQWKELALAQIDSLLYQWGCGPLSHNSLPPARFGAVRVAAVPGRIQNIPLAKREDKVNTLLSCAGLTVGRNKIYVNGEVVSSDNIVRAGDTVFLVRRLRGN
jgi:hypothetical protein